MRFLTISPRLGLKWGIIRGVDMIDGKYLKVDRPSLDLQTNLVCINSINQYASLRFIYPK